MVVQSPQTVNAFLKPSNMACPLVFARQLRYDSDMPDKRIHRGPHPEDAKLFSAQTLPTLRQAVTDMSWLLSNGYADKSTLKLVGDRYKLTSRQRLAVMRCACSDQQRENRATRQVTAEQVVLGKSLVLDGYNVLITIEAALAGGVLFAARDGCIRDLAGIHGTYRKVEETAPAINIISHILNKLTPADVLWLLDKPVSNSGRLKKLITHFADQKKLNWSVELAFSPDKLLAESPHIIATSDSAVLDKCEKWINLTRICIETIAPKYNLKWMDLQ